MKKHALGKSVIFILACWVVFVFCSGCETVKGMGRDIKKADDWFKDNAW